MILQARQQLFKAVFEVVGRRFVARHVLAVFTVLQTVFGERLVLLDLVGVFGTGPFFLDENTHDDKRFIGFHR